MSELLYAIALTKMRGLSLVNAKYLYQQIGSAKELFEQRNNLSDIIPDANPDSFANLFADAASALEIAKREVDFIQQKRMKGIVMNDDCYPYRLRECPDAPLVLYQCGECDLNRRHIINIIGTRKCTEYGKEMVQSLVGSLKELCPDILVVSGLAYGIDICAHRASLANGIDTVGVLAHGLDNIYPSLHRTTAIEMVNNGGGLLTEYTTHTTPEKGNFVRRNRIVAGVSDACVVVESAIKGGSLITANMSFDYNRDVFAFPGRKGDECSAGCNALIKRQKALLIESAEDILDAMGWEPKTSAPKVIQQELFPVFTPNEQLICNSLKGVDEKHINTIVEETRLDYSTVSGLLFELEMKAVVRPLGGGMYKLQLK